MIDIQRVYLTYRIYEVYTYIIHKLNSLNILFIRQYPIQEVQFEVQSTITALPTLFRINCLSIESQGFTFVRLLATAEPNT